MNVELEFITNQEIYTRVITEAVAGAQRYCWIATADIKDLYVHQGRRMVPFLNMLSNLLERGVAIRLIHAKEPGERFRKDFDRYPVLIERLERMLCPRVHLKTICVDGNFVYIGSANLTGAGVGAKAVDKRNFENGIISHDPQLIQQAEEQFDAIWMTSWCDTCKRKEFCPEFGID